MRAVPLTCPPASPARAGSGQFRVLSYGDTDQAQDGGQVTALWEFAGLQKFGEAFLERLSGRQLKNRLLEKVTSQCLWWVL